VRSLEKGGDLLAGVQADGAVVVEGHAIGRLAGFRFIADETALAGDAKPVLTAARRALRSEIVRRVAALEQAPDSVIAFDTLDQIAWDGAPLARLALGGELLKPRVVPLDSDLLVAGEGERIRDRVVRWLDAETVRCFPMLQTIADAKLEGAARGLAFQLAEALAPLPLAGVETLLNHLDRPDRQALGRLGVMIGTTYVFLKGMTRPDAVRLRAALWRARHDMQGALPIPPTGRVSLAVIPDLDPAYYTAIGYPVAGPRAIRIDMLDRLIDRLRCATVQGVMPPDSTIAPVLGCTREVADAVLLALGWGKGEIDGVPVYRRQRPPRTPNVGRRRSPPLGDGERSPFAVLKQLAAK
jgi:ATP-dependent RNA helicase SUPV3L1/SUV3